ncbi:MAG: GtrA family protein [Methanophagales archaeon]|nr:GtrA family protein [Methanophagales archaeon]MCW3140765.1 GtrA family protein [Methanophagales archaeon]
MIKFSIVGVIGAGINTGFLWILTDLAGLYYLFSSVVAIEIAIMMQFMMNDRWTFKDRKTNDVGQFIKRILKSNLWRSGGLSVNVGVLYLFTAYIGVYYLLSNIFGIICAFSLNYILESRLTWGIE